MNEKVILVPRTVCFTDLFLAPVPPPMFHYSYQFASFVCEVAQSSFGAVFLLSTHQLLFCRYIIRKFYTFFGL